LNEGVLLPSRPGDTVPGEHAMHSALSWCCCELYMLCCVIHDPPRTEPRGPAGIASASPHGMDRGYSLDIRLRLPLTTPTSLDRVAALRMGHLHQHANKRFSQSGIAGRRAPSYDSIVIYLSGYKLGHMDPCAPHDRPVGCFSSAGAPAAVVPMPGMVLGALGIYIYMS
jgi:hypothetical protein